MARYAYADPPYFGMSVRFYGHLHPDAHVYDTLEGHKALIERMNDEYDGWAMSLTSTTLADILPLCPRDCRVGAWVKPFASFKKGVNPAYAWEPLVFRGARAKRGSDEQTVRDWCAANITIQRGFVGAKPRDFIWWVLDLLGVRPGDQVEDLFRGSGAVSDVFKEWSEGKLGNPQFGLFEAPP